MKNRRLTAIILAAGQGTRMKSPLPKVLHPVAGSPMILNVIDAVKAIEADEVRVVVGQGKDMVEKVVAYRGGSCFLQKQQKGTGDAVRSANIEDIEGDVLILNGDHPLVDPQELKRAIQEFRDTQAKVALLTCELEDPKTYGRVVRHKGELRAVVELKDASAETAKIKEINTGIYIAQAAALQKYLPLIKTQNKQGEFYLTDIISMCVEDGQKVIGISVSEDCAWGVNTQKELAETTKRLIQRYVEKLMEEGVVFIAPDTVYIEKEVKVEAGTVIYPGVFLKGSTQIGAFCVIEPNSFITNSTIEESVQIKTGSYIESSIIRTKSVVGPYAHIRPETLVGRECKVGNFVELKKVIMGDRSKASHLTYLGDAEIGTDTNIGCGTITCNYAVDKKKYKTKIGDNVFVGSDTQFVAPVEIGDNAVIGSGSTITKDVPENALGVARGRQVIKENYNK